MAIETPAHLELWTYSVADYGRELHYACPVHPCGEMRVVRWENPQELHEGPLVTLRLGKGVGPHPHPHEGVRPLLEAVEHSFMEHLETHTAEQWLIAAQAQEDLQEEAAGNQNQETERAWAAVRSAQSSLQEARDELRELQLAMSEREGAETRLRTALEPFLATVVSLDSCARLFEAVRGALGLPHQQIASGHLYLSVPCFHKDHDNCGTETLAQCGFCSAPCLCSCHA